MLMEVRFGARPPKDASTDGDAERLRIFDVT